MDWAKYLIFKQFVAYFISIIKPNWKEKWNFIH